MHPVSTSPRSETLSKAVAAVQEQLTTESLHGEDNDDETIRVPAESAIDTSIFDVFTDFALDLTCLSPTTSPQPSTSHLPLDRTPSPPTSPILSRSISFASASQTPAASSLSAKKSKKASSPQLSSTVPAGTRGSWPLIKYAGRGTPIDRNRRLEWGGFSGEEVAEDGALFSAARSTSLDSNAIRPSQRSLSPDWNYSSNMSSSLSHSTHSESVSHKDRSVHEPPPELAPLEALGLNNPEDWDSIMQTVLSPTREPELPTPTDTNNADEDVKEESPSPYYSNRKDDKPVLPLMTSEQMAQMNNGVEIDLGIDAALDLGLGRRGGMNWFDLGMLPASASGRESPSVYSSQMVTPRATPPASVRASEHRSTTSAKANPVGADENGKSQVPRWWQKIAMRVRQVHNIITIHKNRF
ncbi:hypothetical protein HYPSUDRAFT_65056 [Hypholoma sublateritium FD-334 SS-4]|uniref:Uncharacterized protein n=1 Tax=Hypholoma sublateritium (strain FD-334 SS-4) TaxID=945553 RepID=A0A0D2Q0N4_HYPSF|nr:hypothetical protein HYPSUDRAFT_65056 [Hypholoma sublateritium FD-334 SS-4]